MASTPPSVDRIRRSNEARDAFLDKVPDYRETDALDRLRAREYSRLDEQGHVYLDYTGSGLYGASQIRSHLEFLLSGVLGNPHSANPASRESTTLLERCRERVLEYFRASPREYVAVFTKNASEALKLVGESYPFEPGDEFLLTFDNHNSVNGIREFDRARGARTRYVPMALPDLRVETRLLRSALAGAPSAGHKLFAYPAQSNFSGVQHPLEWIEEARSQGWDVLLDAAAFVPTNRLDLSIHKPDFVTLSFYKMFGFPTGVGALLARGEALAKLRRPWFAGGTINVASVQADTFVRAAGSAAFEDGTPDFANIPAVECGLDFIESVGVELVHKRVSCLAEWLLGQLKELRHENGRELVRLYGPRDTTMRGATITFNLQDASGRLIDHGLVETSAAARGISLRTGCFCNPGAGEQAMGLTRELLEPCFIGGGSEMNFSDLRRCIDPSGAGAVRVSLGVATNFDDVFAFREYVAEFAQPSPKGV